jgi:D-alanyl-lipoteichoic acid acyltransferase DltB (MBOAT superfamily)
MFTFVALWHDFRPKLLAWGWLVVLFILPEVMARKALPHQRCVGRYFLDSTQCIESGSTSYLLFIFVFFVRSWRKVVVSQVLCHSRSL